MTTTTSQDLRERYEFFREHAGYIVGERAKCALDLARAERRAEEERYTFQWEYEPDLDTATEEQTARIESGETEYLYCVLIDPSGEVGNSLGGIEVSAWRTDPYVRVVEAELAYEALRDA